MFEGREERERERERGGGGGGGGGGQKLHTYSLKFIDSKGGSENS